MNCAICLDPACNHTTAQHEQAMYACRSCGDDVRQWLRESEIDEEWVECPSCRQDRIEARVDEWYDAMVKDRPYDEGGQG